MTRVGAAGGGIALLLAGWSTLNGPGAPTGSWPTATVVRAPIAERLVERGTVAAAHLMLYGSRIPGGPGKLTELVPEGTRVTPGTVLMRFDDATFRQDLARELAARQQAEAELALAREAVRLETLHAESEVDQAKAQVGFARTELADETHGAGQVALADLDAAVSEATRETTRARTALDDLKPLLAEGFITAMELELADQRWQKAVEDERLARLRRDTFATYGRPASVNRAEAGLRAATADLTRQTEAAAARRAQRQSSVMAAQGRLNEIDARIAMVRERLAHTVIHADTEGLVVYRDLFFGGDRRKPQVGDEVWPNQPVIAVPDSSAVVIETRVREIDLHRLAGSTGDRPVTVSVDAYPDIRLRASVALIGALAEADAGHAVKYFPVTITLLDRDERLRPGMTARVDISVATLPDALVIPSQAVFADPDAPTRFHCYVVTTGPLNTRSTTRREVEVLANDGVLIAVGAGLAEGEVVLLADPAVLDIPVREGT